MRRTILFTLLIMGCSPKVYHNRFSHTKRDKQYVYSVLAPIVDSVFHSYNPNRAWEYTLINDERKFYNSLSVEIGFHNDRINEYSVTIDFDSSFQIKEVTQSLGILE